MQTFSNAKMFNGPLTDVHVMANTLEEFWLPRWEAICQLVAEVEQGMSIEKEAGGYHHLPLCTSASSFSTRPMFASPPHCPCVCTAFTLQVCHAGTSDLGSNAC